MKRLNRNQKTRHTNNKKECFLINKIYPIYLLYCVYQFGHVIDVFISDCILSFVLGLPEVNS